MDILPGTTDPGDGDGIPAGDGTMDGDGTILITDGEIPITDGVVLITDGADMALTGMVTTMDIGTVIIKAIGMDSMAMECLLKTTPIRIMDIGKV